jgi:hypothetical protein
MEVHVVALFQKNRNRYFILWICVYKSFTVVRLISLISFMRTRNSAGTHIYIRRFFVSVAYFTKLSVAGLYNVKEWDGRRMVNWTDFKLSARGFVEVIPRICLEELNKTTKNLSHNTLYPDRDSDRVPSEYESRTLPLCQWVWS